MGGDEVRRQGGDRHRRGRWHRRGVRAGAGRGGRQSVVIADMDVERGEVVAKDLGDAATVRAHRRVRPRVGGGPRRGDGRALRRHRPAGEQRRHLRRHAARHAPHRRLGLLPALHVREHGRRARRHPGLLQAHRAAGRGSDRQPVVHRGVALRRLLRPRQGRHQRPHPAAGRRAGRSQHPGQRHRPRADRHRGHSHRRARRDDRRHRERASPSSAAARPQDLVGMCLFLLSDEASWITGQIFNVDGGQIVRS